MVNFTTELDRMSSKQTRNMVNELVSLIRTLHLRPIKSAQTRSWKSKKAKDVYARQTTVQWIGHTSVQTVCARGNIVVVDVRRLVQPVVPEPRFIHPLRGWRPHVVESKHLRSRMNLGQPFRL